MTIGVNNRMDYLGNGATDTYSYGFKIFAATDLRVTVRDADGVDTELTYPTHFTVSGVGAAAGGSVALVNGSFDWLDADGDLEDGFALTIRRVRPLTQATDIRNQTQVFNDVLEDTYDHLMMVDQQQQDEIDRAIKFPETDGSASGMLPAAAERAGGGLYFDDDGNVAVSASIGANLAAIVDNAASALASATAAAASALAAAWSEAQAAAIVLGNFLQSGTGAVERTFTSKARDIVSVMDFGVTGDASTDDATALQLALDTGKGLYFPDAEYKISAGLTLSTAGQKLWFQSRGAKIRPDADTFDALTIAASFFEIHNGWIQGRASNTTSTTSGVRITNGTRGLMLFTRVEGFGYGIRMQGATNGFLNNFIGCYIYNNKRAGFYGCGNATNITGGEIAGSVFGICQTALQAGTTLAVDRDTSGVLGQGVSVTGVTIEGIAEMKTITGAANNGAGLVRITAAGHGYQTGDYISIDSVLGTTEANGVWPITRIDADNFDLKTSAYVNAFSASPDAKARRGYGIYVGNGQGGIDARGCYFEEVPVIYRAGDSFKNDGTTAWTTGVSGGTMEGRYVGNTYHSSYIVMDRVDAMKVTGNYASGTKTGLFNNRGSNYTCSASHFANHGFARTFETTGTQAAIGTTFDPVTKNGSNVFRVRVPTSSSNPTLTVAFELENYGDSTHVATFYQPVRLASTSGLRDSSGQTFGWCTGSPEGAVTAPIGSQRNRRDGGAGTTLYIKESGTGNTGWVAK